jgi:type I restriction enzyme M protein
VLANIAEVENRLWDIADQLWANSGLKPSEYSVPVLGLIFLKHAEHRFEQAHANLEGKGSGRRKIGKTDYQARGALWLPESARFTNLLKLPEGSDLGKAVNEAMRAVEEENEELRGVLPRQYTRLDNKTLKELFKLMNSIPADLEGDAFGQIYEYFLGNFAMKEGQKGGEFFTPVSIVKLIVEIIEPFHGKLFDPACGSGGMFVQSAKFVQRRRKDPSKEISIYGQEKVEANAKVCRMNLTVHGLSGDIKEGNTYYEDLHKSVGKFDFVMANPPFNQDGVDKDRLKDDPRFKLGLPKPDNANYVWIQVFASSLNESGRAGFVMANSATDARGTEQDIRKKLIESGIVDALVSVAPNFFYTVTLPCTLWFLDKGKRKTKRKDDVLFIEARNIFRQIDRAHRDFLPEHVEFLANIVRLYRGEEVITSGGSEKMLGDHFPKTKYAHVPGLCAVASVGEIESHGWSLNPGRYVGTAPRKMQTRSSFAEQFQELTNEFKELTDQARQLERDVLRNSVELSQESQ